MEPVDDIERTAMQSALLRLLKRFSMTDDIIRLSTDIIYYGLGKGAEALAALILIPVLTRALTPSEFGVWDVAMTFFMLIVMVTSLALEPALAAFYLETRKPDERKLVASTAHHFRLVSSISVTVIVLLLARQISRLVFGTPEYASYFRIVGFAIPFFLHINICKQLFRITFTPGKFNLVAAGYAGLYTVLGIFLVTKMEMGINGILFATLAAAVCFSFVGVFLSRGLFAFEFSSRSIISMLKFGFPLVPALLACWVIDFSDRYFLTRMGTLDQVGIYAVGARISSIMVLFTSSFQMAWVPHALNIQHEIHAKERYSRELFFFLAASLTAATAIVIFARPILVVLTQPRYYMAERVIGLLVLATVAYGAYLFISIGLLITKKTVLAGVAITGGAILNLLLNVMLIPRFGMMGAAAATLVSYLAALILLYRFAQKQYPVEYGIPRAIGLALMSIGTMILSSLLGFPKPLVLDLAIRFLLIATFLFCMIRLFFQRQSRVG